MTLSQLALLFTAKTDLRPSKTNLSFLVVCIILALIHQLPLFTPSTHIGGSYDRRYEAVAEAFRRNFYEGREREGASLAVYHKGQLVVNLWGGYADRESDRNWQRDTKTMVYSATKAVASLCIAMQVDRGHLSYSDL
uniref:Beta-lactamase-related domain-containing protein n=1 Tax=Plectus sambesii TaxID=2011161 RepID=A0A914WG42_9BILA